MVVLVRPHFGLLASAASTWRSRDGVLQEVDSSCTTSVCDVMPARRWVPRIAAVALDRLPSRSVYWYFVRRDGMPSWSGIAARIGSSEAAAIMRGKIVARSPLR